MQFIQIRFLDLMNIYTNKQTKNASRLESQVKNF